MRIATLIIVLGFIGLINTGVAAESVITINGKTVRASGRSITVVNDTVIVDDTVVSSVGCKEIVQGSGRTTVKTLSPAAFEALVVDLSADVDISTGDEPRVVVTADDNIVPLILTECAAGRLRISAKESFAAKQKVRIAIQVPMLKEVGLNGAGNIQMAGVTKDSMSMRIRGAGNITATGEVSDLSAIVDGSGEMRLGSLRARAAQVEINGSGDAEVWVTDILRAVINGSGDIRYKGDPPRIHTSIRGSGDIFSVSFKP
jgi:hypothetical protein